MSESWKVLKHTKIKLNRNFFFLNSAIITDRLQRIVALIATVVRRESFRLFYLSLWIVKVCRKFLFINILNQMWKAVLFYSDMRAFQIRMGKINKIIEYEYIFNWNIIIIEKIQYTFQQ